MYPSPLAPERRAQSTRNKRISQRVHYGPPRTEARRDTSEEHTGRTSQRVYPSTEQRESPESASPKESATDRLVWRHVEKLQTSELFAALTACA